MGAKTPDLGDSVFLYTGLVQYSRMRHSSEIYYFLKWQTIQYVFIKILYWENK